MTEHTPSTAEVIAGAVASMLLARDWIRNADTLLLDREAGANCEEVADTLAAVRHELGSTHTLEALGLIGGSLLFLSEQMGCREEVDTLIAERLNMVNAFCGPGGRA